MSNPTSNPTTTTTSSSEGGGFWNDLFNSIFSPELNTVAQRIMNYSFYGLFFVLFTLIFLTNYNPHVIALLTLALGLWMSVNWFIRELAKMPASSRQVQQMPTAQESKEEEKKDV